MAVVADLPPAPVQTRFIKENGFVDPVWVQWFQKLFTRVGGSVATPSTDLDILEAFAENPSYPGLRESQDTQSQVSQLIEPQNGQYIQPINSLETLTAFDGNVRVQRLQSTNNLTTTATDGFLYIPRCAGAPTGTPVAYNGLTPIVFDTTNNKLWAFDGGWIGIVLT